MGTKRGGRCSWEMATTATSRATSREDKPRSVAGAVVGNSYNAQVKMMEIVSIIVGHFLLYAKVRMKFRDNLNVRSLSFYLPINPLCSCNAAWCVCVCVRIYNARLDTRVSYAPSFEIPAWILFVFPVFRHLVVTLLSFLVFLNLCLEFLLSVFSGF